MASRARDDTLEEGVQLQADSYKKTAADAELSASRASDELTIVLPVSEEASAQVLEDLSGGLLTALLPPTLVTDGTERLLNCISTLAVEYRALELLLAHQVAESSRRATMPSFGSGKQRLPTAC